VICSSHTASLNMAARSQHEWDKALCAMRLSQRSFLRFSYFRVVQLFPGPIRSRDDGTRILRNVGTTHPLTWRHISRRDPIRHRVPRNCACDRHHLCTAYSFRVVQKQGAAACLRNFLAKISITPCGQCRTTNALQGRFVKHQHLTLFWHEI
jgi:hypothetical protein